MAEITFPNGTVLTDLHDGDIVCERGHLNPPQTGNPLTGYQVCAFQGWCYSRLSEIKLKTEKLEGENE